jgi:ferredoxin-NADP reductase
MAAQFPLTLLDSRMLAEDVRHLVFQRSDGELLPYLPGQFLQVHFEAAGAPTKRSYSVANAPGNGLALEIAVSYVLGGAATALLSALEHGGTISASGPYGRFCLMDTDQNARYLLIGTGTGITPYRAMLVKLAAMFERASASGDAEKHVVLIQGARTAAELLYSDEFVAFAAKYPQFRYLACTSREAPQAAHGRSGHVQAALAELSLDGTRDIAYLCGNPNMVDECFTQLKDAGFPVPSVRREKYISSK